MEIQTRMPPGPEAKQPHASPSPSVAPHFCWDNGLIQTPLAVLSLPSRPERGLDLEHLPEPHGIHPQDVNPASYLWRLGNTEDGDALGVILRYIPIPAPSWCLSNAPIPKVPDPQRELSTGAALDCECLGAEQGPGSPQALPVCVSIGFSPCSWSGF